MEGYLKVSPELLKKAANDFLSEGEKISSLTSEMMSIVTSLKGVWQGMAYESYAGKFAGLEDDILRINAMIKEHVSDLNEMAENYRIAEEASLEASALLNAEVVV